MKNRLWGFWSAYSDGVGKDQRFSQPFSIRDFTYFAKHLRALVAHSAFQRTGWMILAQGSKGFLQLTAFILLTRIVGAEGYGMYIAILALVSLPSPFVLFGGYNLVVRDIAAGLPTPQALGNSLIITVCTLPLGLAVVALLKLLMLPAIPWVFVFMVGFADYLGGRLTVLVEATNVANGLIWRNAITESAIGISRLLLVYVLFLTEGDIETFINMYFFHMLFFGGASLVWVSLTWGWPTFNLKQVRERLRPGLVFAGIDASDNAYTNIDKVMLGRLASLDATGIYAASSRFVSAAFLPLHAFLSVMYPHFFRAGHEGIDKARQLAIKIFPITAVFGTVTAIGLSLLAPYLTALLGEEFVDVTSAIRFLAIVSLIQGLYFPFADALNGSGLQHLRFRAGVYALISNISLNLLLIPTHGWMGAIWATIASQLVLLFSFIYFVFAMPKRIEK